MSGLSVVPVYLEWNVKQKKKVDGYEIRTDSTVGFDSTQYFITAKSALLMADIRKNINLVLIYKDLNQDLLCNYPCGEISFVNGLCFIFSRYFCCERDRNFAQ